MTGRVGRALRWLLTPRGLLVLALLVRLVLIAEKGNHYYFGDTAEYQASAERLLQGHGLDPDSPRAPLFPIVMALGFWLGGVGNYYVVRFLELIPALALVWVTGRLARRIGGRPAETISLLGMAVAPTIVFVAGMLYPTTLYTLILAGLTLAAWEIYERPRARWGAAFGVLVALGWWTDPVVLAPALALLAWMALGLRRGRRPLAGALLAAVVLAAALLVPYLHWKGSAGHGGNMFMAKAQYALWSARSDPVLSAHRLVRYGPGVRFEALDPPRFVAREAALFARQPGEYAHDVLWEFGHFFQPLPDRVQSQNRYNRPLVLLVGAAYFVVVLMFAPIGLLAGAGPRRGRWLLAAVVFSVAAFYALFFTQTRYRIPVEPELIVLAALALQRLFPRLSALAAGDDPAAGPAAA